MAKDTSHVKINYKVQPPRLVCLNCKGYEHEMPDKPTPIPIFVGIMESYVKMHEDCKSKKS